MPKFLINFFNKLRKRDYFIEQNELLSDKYKKSISSIYKDTKALYGLEEKHGKYGKMAHYSMIFKSNWDSVFSILNSIATKHNVEIAFPFFSKPFVEHCLNMPTSKRYLKALQDIISEKA